MEVVIKTSVPVYVTVDLDDGTVTEVHVDVEAPMKYGPEVEINDPGLPTPEIREQAVAIAEGGAEWPVWEFGW